MKKSAIALAVTAGLFASAATYADTTFYGSFRTSLFMNDPDAPGTDATWGVQDEGSRWGVRGSEDLGNGLSATYQLEARVNSGSFDQGFAADGPNAFGGRLLWMGLEGGFGALRIGTQWSPHYIDVMSRMDHFNSVSIFGSNYVGVYRRNNSILYQTPASLDMFKFSALTQLNANANTRDFDTYNLAVSANFGPAGMGFTYFSDEFADADVWAVAADVSFAGATLAASYEDVDSVIDFINVYGDYTFGNNIVRAQWGRTDNGDSTDDFAVGFQHNLSSRTRLWAEYADIDDLRKEFSVGMRHDF